MARPKNKFLEARLYMAGGSVGLLLILWSVFAVKDRPLLSDNAAATDASVAEVIATAAPAPTAATTSSSSSTSAAQATAAPTAEPTAAPTATPQPQTRSRAS